MRVNPNLSSVMSDGIAGTAAQLQSAVQQLSTSRRVNLPSDDPYAAAANIRSVAQSSNVDRYTANAGGVLSQLQMADAALGNVVSALTQAVSLGTRGADGSVNSTNRAAIAAQITALQQQVVDQANVRYNGNPLFAGTSGAASAFIADPTSASGFSYQGNASTNVVTIGDGTQVPATLAGAAIFNNPAGDVLGSLATLGTALQGGDQTAIAQATAGVRRAIDVVGQQRTIIAGTTTQISAQENYLGQETVSLSTQQQSLTGVDLSSAITQMTQAQTAHSAMLAAAAKLLPVSLLDYLK